jgi:4-hydroxy-tetrahydrodipicolinate synthase
MRHGGKGCISATANVNPASIHALFAQWKGEQADAMQQGLDAVRAIFQRSPMIPALKEAVAHWSGDREWARVRPPLVELTAAQSTALVADLERIGFSMPGLRER